MNDQDINSLDNALYELLNKYINVDIGILDEYSSEYFILRDMSVNLINNINSTEF